MEKVKVDGKTFVIDEMVKTMESKDIINMIALEVEKASNKYKEAQKRDLADKAKKEKKDNLVKAILALAEEEEEEDAINDAIDEATKKMDINQSFKVIDAIHDILGL